MRNKSFLTIQDLNDSLCQTPTKLLLEISRTISKHLALCRSSPFKFSQPIDYRRYISTRLDGLGYTVAYSWWANEDRTDNLAIFYKTSAVNVLAFVGVDNFLNTVS